MEDFTFFYYGMLLSYCLEFDMNYFIQKTQAFFLELIEQFEITSNWEHCYI
jgi:hypothetical protein